MLRLWDGNSNIGSGSKLDFAAARHPGEHLHHRGLAHSLSEVMFNTSPAALSCHITVIMFVLLAFRTDNC